MSLDDLFEPMTAPHSSHINPDILARLVELLPQRPGQGIWLSKLGYQPTPVDSKYVRDSYRGAVIRGLGVSKKRVITSTRRLTDGSRDVQIGLAADSEDAPAAF